MKILLALLMISTAAAQVRINLGGPAYTDATGAWEADRGCVGGQVATDQDPAWGATEMPTSAPVYRSKRYGKTFTCTYALPDGVYIVDLYLIESTATMAGVLGRAFSVSINSVPVLVNYDMWAEVGANVPIKKSFQTLAVNGTGIKIVFTTLYRSAFANGLAIRPPAAAPATGLAVTCSTGTIEMTTLTAAQFTTENASFANNQSFVVMHDVPAKYRFLHFMLDPITAPVSAIGSKLFMSVITGSSQLVPQFEFGSATEYWFDRVPPPTLLSGPYDVAVMFSSTAPLGDGTTSNFTAGAVRWEACGFVVN